MKTLQLPDAITDEDIAEYVRINGRERLRWFIHEELRAANRALPFPESAMEMFRASELFRLPDPPVWYRRELEFKFRRGFHDGCQDAISCIFDLSKKGYGRPSEIGNILCRFLDQLCRWRHNVWTDDCTKYEFDGAHPVLKQEPWMKLREAVFARDGHQCLRCDSTERLEAHHQLPVAEGGLAEMSNLETLCYTCHRVPPNPKDDPDDRLSTEQARMLVSPLRALTGVDWDWMNCGSGAKYQLMPDRRAGPEIDDFWMWHAAYRQQYFNNRPNAVVSLIKSFHRWSAIQSSKGVACV